MVPWNQCWSLVIINNFLVGSCSCYSTFFSYSYYYFPSLVLRAYYRKTEWDTEKWFSQEVWNCLRAILSTVFMTGFHWVFMILQKADLKVYARFQKTGQSEFYGIFFQDTLDICPSGKGVFLRYLENSGLQNFLKNVSDQFSWHFSAKTRKKK